MVSRLVYRRAEYGKSTLLEMYKKLIKEFRKGFSSLNLQNMRGQYIENMKNRNSI